MPTTALMLVPLMLFAALAVDVGGWTVMANRIQSAADAASLAAAAHLPDQGEADRAAQEVAELNGYVDGVGGVTVVTAFPTTTTVRVTITAPGERYLSQVVSRDPLDITRFADATSLVPVGMGSPTNVLGFGPYSLGGLAPSNYWMLENNDCSVAHYGDLRAAQYLAKPWCGESLGLEPNPYWKRATDGREGGYFYVVEIPPGLNVTSRLMVFDPGKCPAYGNKPADGGWSNADPEIGTRLQWRRWDTNATPLIDTDDAPVSAWWGSDACAADLPYPDMDWTDQTQGWTETPFVFPANTTGETETHLIQTRVLDATQQGWNHYSYWVRPDNGTTSCLTIGSGVCPTIRAEGFIATQARSNVNGEAMELYLAEVGPEYAGRTMQVLIWDPGESMDNIQVLDPLGTSLDFTWESDDEVNHGADNPSDDCGGNPCLYLDPNSNAYAPKLSLPGWGNHWRFNGRLISLNVPLDSQVDFPAYASSGQGYWFRIRFEPISTKKAKEWASFSVQMTGDPIRLTD